MGTAQKCFGANHPRGELCFTSRNIAPIGELRNGKIWVKLYSATSILTGICLQDDLKKVSRRSKTLCSCKFAFPFQTGFEVLTKTPSDTSVKGLIQSERARCFFFFPLQHFACQSYPSLFVFDPLQTRGNIEIASSLRNAQPGSRPAPATPRGKRARGQHARLRASQAASAAAPGVPPSVGSA